MAIRAIVLTILGLLIVSPAQAERQTYNPRALGVTYHDLERAQAFQQRQAMYAEMGMAGPAYGNRRHNRRISPEQQYQVLTLHEQFKERFPVHPGLYRDAYDRGSWTRSTDGGGNPRDRWFGR